jgi:hypothetical protein
MSATIAEQLHVAATWADTDPAYRPTAPLLRYLARHIAAGALDVSRLPPPLPDEGAWAGAVRRLAQIGVDVMAMRGDEVST